MRLISLNTWGGKLYQPLTRFVEENSQTTDVFCFQEVFDTKSAFKKHSDFRINLYREIGKVLKDHDGFFTSSIDNYISGSFQDHFIDFDLKSGLAIFTKKELKVKDRGYFSIFGQKNNFNPKDSNTMPRIAQYLTLELTGKSLTIVNIHAIWVREGKKDTPSRIKQSNCINQFLESKNGNKILCGDFNLDINTESIKILEKHMKNLIKEYNIPTTRNKLFPGNEKFADYVFVSPDIKVINFKVPDIEISDHLPIILEFS